MKTSLQPKTESSGTTSVRGPLQRRCGCSGAKTCGQCNKKQELSHNSTLDLDRSLRRSSDELTVPGSERHPGHDFSKVRVHSDATVNDQTQSGGLDPKFMQTTETAPATDKDISMGDEFKNTSTAPVVDQVELVDSPTGAVGGYPDKIDTCDASLNTPGPFNDNFYIGSVANVHQVQFHVSQGYPGDLRATRIVNRTAEGRGKKFSKSGNDGPPDHEYRYTRDKMVIADAPGWCSTVTDTDFPLTYKGDFAVYAWDAPTKKILASISYQVEIEKTHYVQRDPVNTVTVTDKKIGGTVASPVKPKK